MIHLEYIERSQSVQTVPIICVQCEQRTCAEVCPADAIKRTGVARDEANRSATGGYVKKPRPVGTG